MAKGRTKGSADSSPEIRPALNPEARENQMISLAVNLAEKQLQDGTASSQVITHFLKLASSNNKREQEILELQKELIAAKTENIRTRDRMDKLYEDAIAAMKQYGGHGDAEDEER